MKQVFVLRPHPHPSRERACQFIQAAPDGYMVTVHEAKRTTDQNSKFHAICTDLSKSGLHWAGELRTAAQWKVLLVSGHAIATKEGADMVPGLEGEFVNLRESTALMSVKRGSSLIEYSLAFCAEHVVNMSAYDET